MNSYHIPYNEYLVSDEALISGNGLSPYQRPATIFTNTHSTASRQQRAIFYAVLIQIQMHS